MKDDILKLLIASGVYEVLPDGTVLSNRRRKGKVLTPASYWTPFGLTVHNILPDGNRVPDPVECKLFKTEREAIDAYEKFLVKWSECERDMEGKFIEVGNKIAPPSEVKILAEKLKDSDISDEFGSW